jgi:ribosome-associated protein
MAKKTVKKTAAKKTAKSPSRPAKSSGGKLSGKSKNPAKKSNVKKPISDKEREIREANAIANSEKKKKPATKRPKKISTDHELKGLLDAVIEGMKERKAKNIMVLDLKQIENRVTDYFVICDADSNTHVSSIADSVEETVEKLAKEKAYHVEGTQNGEWVLIDYINVVAHVFLREMREHYNIEGLWGDAEITLIND